MEERGLSRERAAAGLCICDIDERTESSRQMERVRRAELPHNREKHRTFATWENERDEFTKAVYFAEGEGPAVLVMTGVTGSGKSHLIEAIGRHCLSLGQSVKYVTAEDLLRRTRDAFDGTDLDVFGNTLGECYVAEVLLLDELGAENTTPWAQTQLSALVDDRYRNGKRLVVATNLGPEEMAVKLGERLASRLWDTQTGDVAHLILKAEDYRKKGGLTNG